MQKCEGCRTVKCEYTNEYPRKSPMGEWWHSECYTTAIEEAEIAELEYNEYRRHHADPHAENYRSGLNSEQQAWQDQMDAGWEY